MEEWGVGEMKKVVVTGVAGFLGPHVAKVFVNAGWEVLGIDNLTTFELERCKYDIKKARKYSLKVLKGLGVRFLKWDVRSLNPKADVFKDVDLIVHCSAQPAMTVAIENPDYDCGVNVAGLVNMLEVARFNKCAFINCSSIHVYGNNLNTGLVEKQTRFEKVISPEIDEGCEILDGELTPLHVSKRCTELYVRSYAETYGIRAASFRFTGMYGPGQFGGMDHGWVANFAIRAVTGKEIVVFGTDLQVRDILYAGDAAKSFLGWFENQGKSTIYNIGGGLECSISLQECLAKLTNITGNDLVVKEEPKRLGDLWYFVCSYEKAFKDFGWKPYTLPSDGLKKMVDWVKDNEEVFV